MNWLFVFIGGGLGSLLRFGFSHWFAGNVQTHFPFATLCSNLASSFIAGFFLGYMTLRPEHSYSVKLMMLVGFCGGFSTFSTFSSETFELLRHGMFNTAFYNITANFAGTLCMTWIGWMVGMNVGSSH